MKFKTYLEQLKESDPEAYEQVYKELYGQIFDDVYNQMFNPSPEFDIPTASDEELMNEFDAISGNDFDLDNNFSTYFEGDPETIEDSSMIISSDELDAINEEIDRLHYEMNILSENIDEPLPMIEDDFESFDEFLRDNIIGMCEVFPVQLVPQMIALLKSKDFQLLDSSIISESDVKEMVKMYENLNSEKLLYIIIDFPIKTFFICEHADQIKSGNVIFNFNSIITKLYENEYNFNELGYNYDNIL